MLKALTDQKPLISIFLRVNFKRLSSVREIITFELSCVHKNDAFQKKRFFLFPSLQAYNAECKLKLYMQNHVVS